MSQARQHDEAHTAQDKRHWVRLTWVCNNRCLFCLDSNVQTGTVREPDEVRREIREGVEGGAERLILSGGEPTLHPDFVELLSFGRQCGYRWIQTVSNGRMFAYRRFTKSAIKAGLNEATFSMHGHTEQLHDRLVGVKGAFSQSIQGMRSLLDEGAVVNIDVVIQALNISHLSEIIEFYLNQGIREFDLLWLVPFGRAWKNHQLLFCDPKTGLPYLQEAIRLALDASAVVWTNRLPPQLLEGHEDLIQDPHKLHDELRGRRLEFDALFEQAKPLVCRQPVRCRQCFLEGLCQELEQTVAAKESGRLQAGRVDLGTQGDGDADAMEPAAMLRLSSDRVDRAAAFVRDLRQAPAKLVLELGPLADKLDPFQADFGDRVELLRVASSHPATLDTLLGSSGGDVEILLNQQSASWLLERAAFVRTHSDRVLFSLASFLSLPALVRSGTNPVAALSPFAGSRVRLVNLPPCVLPGADCLNEPQAISTQALPGRTGGDLSTFADHYIRHLYRVYSLRCERCTQREACPGMPVHYVRRFGYGIIAGPLP